MIIGISGATAAGKTTFLSNILGAVDRDWVACLHHDSYYFSPEEMPDRLREIGNFDHPDAFDNALFIDHLRTLRGGHHVECPVYDYTTHRRCLETRRVEARPVLLVEGIMTLAIPEVRGLLDIKVFIDAPADLRFLRRLRRDLAERGRSPESVITQYLSTVRPMHHQYVEASREHADVIVPGHGCNAVAVGPGLWRKTPSSQAPLAI